MIALRGISTGDGRNVDQTVYIPAPRGLKEKDVMYAFVMSGAPTSSGWTDIHLTAATGVHTLRKIAGPSEPGGYLFDAGVGNIIAPATIVALSGVDNVTPEDGVAMTENSAGGGQSVLTAPSITTKTDRAWHLVCFAVLGLSATVISAPGGGYTEIVPSFGDPTSHDILRVDARMIYKAGATSTVAAIQDDTAAWSATSYSIRPDSSLAQDPGPYAITLEGGIDRITQEDNLGVLITEESSLMIRALLTEDERGYIYLEDGSGVLLGDPGLFYAIAQEKQGDAPGTIALVGAAGAILSTSTDVVNTPTFDAGALRTLGNLLICITTQISSGTPPSITAGWSVAVQAGVSNCITIYYRIATGGDSAPSITPAAGGSVLSQLIEYSGVSPTPLDRTGSGNATGTSPVVATTGGVDLRTGDLIITAAHIGYLTSAARTLTDTYNNGTTPNNIFNNNAVSSTGHFNNSWGITGSSAVADSDSMAYPNANFSIGTLVIASFKSGGNINSNDRVLLEDGTGVILSEEFDTQPIFRSYDLETGVDRFLLENGADILISEEPSPSFGSAVFVVAADTINAISDSAVRSAQAFSRTAADSIASLSDAASRLTVFIRTASDSIGSISDVASRLIKVSRTASDSLGAISDSAVRSAQSFARTTSDTVNALSDSATRLVNLPRIASDALSAISEATLTAKGVTRTAADTIGAISDSAVRSAQSFSRTASDTINALSDNTIRNAQSFARTVADTISALSDSAVRAATDRIRTASDSLGALSDSAVRAAQSFVRTATDSINTISDNPTRLTTAPRIATDALAAITEATVIARGIARTAADSLSAISDSAIRATTARVRTADDVLNALSDSATRNAQNFLRTASDTLAAIAESTFVQKGILRTASDTLSAISDTAVRAVSNKTRTASDSLNALSDNAVRNAQAFVRTAADALGAITESTTIARGVSRTASDTIGAISDVATRLTAKSLTAVDSLSAISDNAVRSAQSFARTAVDSLGSISDTATKITSQLRVATDTISAMTDTVARSIGRFRTASDSLNAISDSTTRSPQAFVRSAVDLLGNLIDAAVSAFSALTRPFQDVDAITYSRDGMGQVYSRDGGVSYSRNGIGETKSRDGGITGSRDGIGVIKER